jgi:predicted Zn-dependent protease
MKPLPFEDQRCLNAAVGWLGLGSHTEAAIELENLTAENRDHPAVLEIRWQVFARAKRWEAALEVASGLMQSRPESPAGWVHRSYSLHELKRTGEARDNLLRVVDRFPDDSTMRYNLACYECQLGRPQRAKHWLDQALAIGDPAQIKQMALEDPDLEPLRRHIENL